MSKEEESLTQQEIAPCADNSSVTAENIAAPQQEPVEIKDDATRQGAADTGNAEENAERTNGFDSALIRLNRNQTLKLTLTAVFAALAVVAKVYVFPIDTVLISLAYIPLFIAGIFLGPYLGFAAGIIGDSLGYLIMPHGVWSPFTMVATGLLGFIPGFVFHFERIFKLETRGIGGDGKTCPKNWAKAVVNNPYFRIVLSLVFVLIICTAAINTFSQWFYSSKKSSFWALLALRMTWQPLIAACNTVVVCALYPLLKIALKKMRV